MELINKFIYIIINFMTIITYIENYNNFFAYLVLFIILFFNIIFAFETLY